MTSHPIELYHTPDASFVTAEVVPQITDKNISDWNDDWLPAMQAHIDQLKNQGVEKPLWPQSSHWDWSTKAKATSQLIAYQQFSVVYDNMTQAMMLVHSLAQSKIVPTNGQHLVYIDYLEVAPWNQKKVSNGAPTLSGLGSALVLEAILHSHDEGFKGRVGLHSLPQSNRFYEDALGMTPLGPDSNKQNLIYFEFTEDQSSTFIDQGSPS